MPHARKRLTALILASAVMSGIAAVLAIVAIVYAFSIPAPKTDRAAAVEGAAPGATWKTIPDLPDWSGRWHPATPAGPAQFHNTVVRFKPKAAAAYAELARIADAGGDVPTRGYRCIARGFPGGMVGNEVYFDFAYTPGAVLITDVGQWNRHIYTDGRPHADMIDTFQGDSIGHWEGDTLVVDTTSLDPGNEIFYGLPGGKNMHVSERIHLDPDAKDVLAIDFVLDAPETLAEPFHYTNRYNRIREPIAEFDCAQNNRDLNPQTGLQHLDMTPPP